MVLGESGVEDDSVDLVNPPPEVEYFEPVAIDDTVVHNFVSQFRFTRSSGFCRTSFEKCTHCI